MYSWRGGDKGANLHGVGNSVIAREGIKNY